MSRRAQVATRARTQPLLVSRAISSVCARVSAALLFAGRRSRDGTQKGSLVRARDLRPAGRPAGRRQSRATPTLRAQRAILTSELENLARRDESLSRCSVSSQPDEQGALLRQRELIPRRLRSIACHRLHGRISGRGESFICCVWARAGQTQTQQTKAANWRPPALASTRAKPPRRRCIAVHFER